MLHACIQGVYLAVSLSMANLERKQLVLGQRLWQVCPRGVEKGAAPPVPDMHRGVCGSCSRMLMWFL